MRLRKGQIIFDKPCEMVGLITEVGESPDRPGRLYVKGENIAIYWCGEFIINRKVFYFDYEPVKERELYEDLVIREPEDSRQFTSDDAVALLKGVV